MKFMRLGTRPDTFYTAEATRMMLSDLPSDLTVRIKNITYLLHKFPLLPKCGLLQHLCADKADLSCIALELNDIPGGEDAFELCAKFCYGIAIDLSAHNFVQAICAAKFLRMTESVEKGNFVSKLEIFFNSCILEGWKDSVVTLHTTERFLELSENLGIIRRCIDSIVDKILTPPTKVRWSYTYTRQGYAQKKHHKSAPKDWWTEDIADLSIDLFRCIVSTVKSTKMLPPPLIGEALHVYACRWLPDVTRHTRPYPETSTASQATQEESLNRKRQLEIIVSMIPEEIGSVSVGFLLRLLSTANLIGASPVTKAQLVKKCSLQLEEATLNDLMLPSRDSSGDHHVYDIDLVRAVLEGFEMQWRKSYSRDKHSIELIRKVGKLIDSYLQVIATDANMSVQEIVSLANALPEFARPEHDDLYKAINIYLQEHQEMTKEEKKWLCSILDCRKLSREVCAHVVKNERLPLRTVVQVIFYEQEKNARNATRSHKHQQSETKPQGREAIEISGESLKRLQVGSSARSSKEDGGRQRSAPSSTRPKFEPESEHKSRRNSKVEEMQSDKVREITEEGRKLDPKQIRIQRSKEHDRHKGK